MSKEIPKSNINYCSKNDVESSRDELIDRYSSTSNEVSTSLKDKEFLFVCEKNYMHLFDENNFLQLNSKSKYSKQKGNVFRVDANMHEKIAKLHQCTRGNFCTVFFTIILTYI